MNLERDPNYHSIVENIELPLEFYGTDPEHDGGYQYLKEALENGIDSQIEFLAEVSFDNGVTYDIFFSGLLDLTTLIEIEHLKKFQCAIIRNNLWAKFINRKSIPVDIRSAVDLDGVAKTPMNNQTPTLPNQIINQSFESTNEFHGTVTFAMSTNTYGALNFINVTSDEIAVRFDVQRIAQSTRPDPLFTVDFAGDHDFDIEVYLRDGNNFVDSYIDVKLQINDDAVISLTESNIGVNGVNGRTKYEYASTITLEKGDAIRLYIQKMSAGADVEWMTTPEFSFFNITAHTIFPDTSAEGFYIHDVAMGVMDRIVGLNGRFYSLYFGGPAATFSGSSAPDDPYSVNGCGFDYQLFKGLHVRGYTLAQKPFSTSFDDWWDGANNIFNLGLGYEDVELPDGGGIETREVIRVEEKGGFYDSSSNSVDLENVGGQEDGSGGGIEISYDADYLFTSIQIGYRKWEAEASSGIDDPQTVHTYASRFKTVGGPAQKDIQIISPFLAASLAIEQTRRETLQIGKDWKLDEDTIIIQTDETETPEPIRLYSASLITGLLNADTRYNVRLTPASNFARWQNYIANAFQSYTGDVFRFVKGEGNTDMTFSNPAATGCDAEAGSSADENANIVVGSDFLFLPIIFKFEHPLTWIEYKAIRDNRKKSIGITWYDNLGSLRVSKLFIKKLLFKVNESIATFECWLRASSGTSFDSTLITFDSTFITFDAT